MKAMRVPVALQDRLGPEATFGLIEMFDSEMEREREQVLSVAADRFERRLTEEISTLRVEVGRELHEGLAGIRQELSAARVEMLKWSFLFWIGQVAAMAGLLSYMLRSTGP